MDIFGFFILGFAVMFIGFATGRLGDRHFGHLNVPHHWIYGVVMIIASFFFAASIFGLMLFSFGTGHFISDFHDFKHLRFWGADEKHKWEFWDIK